MRRATGVMESSRLALADLEMDLVKRRVTWKGREIGLPPRELVLLEYLLQNQGQVVSKGSLMEHVWDYNFDPQTSVVETAVSRLRAKLSDVCGNRVLIRTVRGIGYVLECPRP